MKNNKLSSQWERMYNIEKQHWWYEFINNVLLSNFKNLIQKESTKLTVLDIGCGTGNLLEKLSNNNINLIGLEYSKEALNFSTKRGCKNLLQGDGNYLPLKDNSIDIIFCIDVLEVESIKPSLLLSEISRILKSSGKAYIITTAFQCLYSRHDRIVGAARRFSKKQISILTKENRLQIIHSTFLFFLLFPIMSLWKLVHPPNSTQKFGESDPIDLELSAKPINYLLSLICKLELFLLNFVKLPIGTSFFFIARKDHG